MDYDYPAKMSFMGHLGARLLLIVKGLLAIPLYVGVMFYGVAAMLAIFFAFWSILIVGKFPGPLFRFVRGFMQYQYRVMSYYPLFMTNHWMPTSSHPLRIEAEQPQRSSRLLLLFVKLPATVLGMVTGVAGLGSLFLMVFSVVGWLGVLITGRYPRWTFRMSRSLLGWHYRLYVWQTLMRDDACMFGSNSKVKTLTFASVAAYLVVAIGVPVLGAMVYMGQLDTSSVATDRVLGVDLQNPDFADLDLQEIRNFSIGGYSLDGLTTSQRIR